MKQDQSSVPALMAPEKRKISFRDLFGGPRRAERYYRAEDGRGLCLLWLEAPRFGEVRAFPCAIWEPGRELLFFDSSVSPQAGEHNRALMERWKELEPASLLPSLRVEALDRAAFRELFRTMGKVDIRDGSH